MKKKGDCPENNLLCRNGLLQNGKASKEHWRMQIGRVWSGVFHMHGYHQEAGEDVASFLAPESHNPSVMTGSEHRADDLSEDCEELWLGIEEMALAEEEFDIEQSTGEECTDDEG
ncbi:hypothetical protein EDC04DRAFT_2610922 [Pisolithus marmoratus]|nr:hypothetical protein EDC04DRAFT_2610922 [Pisolithus marmoratus]